MAWELIKELFPCGQKFADLPNDVTGDMLDNSNLTFVWYTQPLMAREMAISQHTYAFSKDNAYMAGVDYDVYKGTDHPDPLVYPLNVYGAAMVNDFIALHKGGVE